MANGPYRTDPYARPASMPPAAGWAPAYPTEGVISRRLFGYLVDLVMIFLLAALLAVAIGIIGVITLGFGWALFAVLPFTGILYSAITLGGPKQATIGMRMMGVRGLDAISGGPVDHLRAAVHALLFYVAPALGRRRAHRGRPKRPAHGPRSPRRPHVRAQPLNF